MKRAVALLVVCLTTREASAQVPPARHALRSAPEPPLFALTLKRRLGVDVAETLLRSSDPPDRQRGFERLGDIGTAQALDLLLRAFEIGGAARSAQDRLVAARALAPHASVARVRDFLVRLMLGVGSNPERPEAIDGMIERAAALALAATGDDAALSALSKALRQPGHVADTARDALLAFPPRNLQPIVQDLRAATPIFASTLGELGDARAVPALSSLVRNAPSEVRTAAAVALSRLGVTDTIELARSWLEHENGSNFRIAGARILLQFRTPDAAAAVSRLLLDEATRAVGIELANSESLPALTPTLLKLAASADPEEQSALFSALGLAASREAFSFLGGALSARETSSVAALALALAPETRAESVLEQALRSASTRRAAVRASLVRTLAQDSTPSGFRGAVRELASSGDPSDRALFFQASALASPQRAAELLKDADLSQIRALSRDALRPEVALALADRLALETDPAVREALAACLVSPAAAERVPSAVLLDLLEARGLAAPLAARVLGTRDSLSLRPRIASLLSSDDAVLRSQAALGLGESADGSALGLLERAYRFETNADVRLAIVRAIATRHEPARRRALLLARTLDGSASVRKTAALGLTGAGTPGAVNGSQSAWLQITQNADASLGSAPALGALVSTESGLAVPVFADPDGVLLLPALPSGPFQVRLAAPARTDNASSPRQP